MLASMSSAQSTRTRLRASGRSSSAASSGRSTRSARNICRSTSRNFNSATTIGIMPISSERRSRGARVMLPPSWKSEIENTIDEKQAAAEERNHSEDNKKASDIAAEIKALNDTYGTQEQKRNRNEAVKRATDIATIGLLFGTVLFTGLSWCEFK